MAGPAAWITAFAGRLRFPQLFWLTAGLFLLDLVVPDFVPFADEVLLGLATLLLANWRKRREHDPDPEDDDDPKVIDAEVVDDDPT